jgi:hypothetical protein
MILPPSAAFGSLDLPWKPGHLRSAYGALCCHRFKPQNQTDDIFLAQILGHKLLGPNASLSVGQSYKDFYQAGRLSCCDSFNLGSCMRRHHQQTQGACHRRKTRGSGRSQNRSHQRFFISPRGVSSRSSGLSFWSAKISSQDQVTLVSALLARSLATYILHNAI